MPQHPLLDEVPPPSTVPSGGSGISPSTGISAITRHNKKIAVFVVAYGETYRFEIPGESPSGDVSVRASKLAKIVENTILQAYENYTQKETRV